MNRRYHKSIMTVWNTHLFLVGNSQVFYKDQSGETLRRICYIPCNIPVANADTGLVEDIVATELPTLHLRFLRRYRDLVLKLRGKEIWSEAPKTVWDQRRTLQLKLDPLKAFLKVGSSRMQVVMKNGAEVSLTKFNEAFKAFQKFGTDRRIKDEDLKVATKHVMSTFGIDTQTRKACKVCDKKPSAANCGDHWASGSNRTTKYFFQGIEIHRRDKDGNAQGGNVYEPGFGFGIHIA